jgi:hypothetical protein
MKLLGGALIAAGAVGLYARFNTYTTTGTTGTTTTLVQYDPANILLKIPPTGSLVDAGTLVDLGLVLAGFWLWRGGRLF